MNKLWLAAFVALILSVNGGQFAAAATETISGTLFFNSGVDTTPPAFDNVINHTHIGNTSFSYDIDATDAKSSIDSFWFNDTSAFIINKTTGVVVNATELDALMTYWLNVSVNDTNGYITSEIFFINITAAAQQVFPGLIALEQERENVFYVYFYTPNQNYDDVMPDNSLFYSLDRNALVYKDPNGIITEIT
jgi:hypothetical protein